LRQSGHELLTEPGVEQPEDLVVVEGHDDELVLGVELEGVAERLKEATFSRLDRSAVELDHVSLSAALLGREREGRQQRRLPDARDSVQEGDQRRRVRVEELGERGQLLVAAYQPLRGPAPREIRDSQCHLPSNRGYADLMEFSPARHRVRAPRS
jgi:hypothetical protein